MFVEIRGQSSFFNFIVILYYGSEITSQTDKFKGISVESETPSTCAVAEAADVLRDLVLPMLTAKLAFIP